MKPNDVRRLRAAIDAIEAEAKWFNNRKHICAELKLLRMSVHLQARIAFKILAKYG